MYTRERTAFHMLRQLPKNQRQSLHFVSALPLAALPLAHHPFTP
jgi:hypothetical protein